MKTVYQTSIISITKQSLNSTNNLTQMFYMICEKKSKKYWISVLNKMEKTLPVKICYLN